jgi:hypothetical protein
VCLECVKKGYEILVAAEKGKPTAHRTTHAGVPVLQKLWKWIVGKTSIRA